MLFKKKKKASYSCRIAYERSEAAREQRIALYKTDQQEQQRQTEIDQEYFQTWLLILSLLGPKLSQMFVV